jgi:SAM-dependent methyltransferase
VSPAPPALERHEWGSAPELYGPRHDFRESLILRRLLPSLPGPDVLNAGAGAGSLTLRMADAGLRVTSVDESPAFVERLERRLAECHPGRDLPVARGDLRALDLPDAAFDGAACGEVLEHVEDDRAALGELARVLRHGGVLVATVPAGPERMDWVDAWAGHRRRYAADALEALVGEAGFSDVRITAWGFPLTGLYERVVYRRLLRRRLGRPDAQNLGAAPRAARPLAAAVRGALEVDTLFLGRRPGYLGLIVEARRP